MTASRGGIPVRLRETSPAVWTVVLAAVIVVLAWPIANGPGKATLDESWKIALHLAAGMRLQHGVDIVFTYGPVRFGDPIGTISIRRGLGSGPSKASVTYEFLSVPWLRP